MPTRSWTDLLSDAGETGNYDPLPEGDYDFVIKEANAKTASTGRTMYVAKMAVEGGPFNGKTVWHNFVLVPENPTALGWFFKNMGTLGLGQEYFNSNPSDHHVAEALVGRRFRGQVVIRKWQGQDKNEIKSFFPPAGSAVGGGGAPVPPTATAHAAPQPPAAPVTPPPAPPAAPAPPPVQAPETPPVQAEEAPAPAPTVAPEPAPDNVPDPVSGNGNGEAKKEQQDAAEATPPPPLPTSNTPAEAPASPEPAPEPETAAAGSIPPPPPF